MDWIFLSPHLDDAAFSCGGLIWELTRAGHSVAVLTICAGDPPAGSISAYAGSLHTRWATGLNAVAVRRDEDQRACQILGAIPRYFPFLDAVYRRSPADGIPLYTSDEALFGGLNPLDDDLIESLRRELEVALPGGSEVCCPLAIGGHVDHRLVRMAAERLSRPLWYYADYPYVALSENSLEAFTRGLSSKLFPVSEGGLAAWGASMAVYASQISTFWNDEAEMRAAIATYCSRERGIRLWSR